MERWKFPEYNQPSNKWVWATQYVRISQLWGMGTIRCMRPYPCKRRGCVEPMTSKWQLRNLNKRVYKPKLGVMDDKLMSHDPENRSSYILLNTVDPKSLSY